MLANAATLFSVAAGGAPAGNRGAFAGVVGNEFTVGAADLLVTALGFEDAGLDGLNGSHEVGIWNVGGGALLGSATVTNADPLDGAWRFAQLGTSITLIAGQSYRIGGHTGGTDNFTDADFTGGVPTPFSISTDAALSNGALTSSNRFVPGAFAFPTNDGTLSDLRWVPANAQYTVVPEPGAGVLAALTGSLLLLRRRRR